jgi:hypothetical protein
MLRRLVEWFSFALLDGSFIDVLTAEDSILIPCIESNSKSNLILPREAAKNAKPIEQTGCCSDPI